MKTCPTCAATYPNDFALCPRDGATLRSTAGLEPGAIIREKYKILSEIGRGGMGVVYKARHLIWNEDKAIKVLTATGDAAQPGLKALMAEAQLMRHLQHPNIVRVEDADRTEDGQPFVVMEYVDGQSLRGRLKSGGKLAPELVLSIGQQACAALAAAHERGIVHRDIKPENLLLAKGADGSETLKVIDFGIAKVREEAGLGFTGMLTGTTGLFVGTAYYASPEQARGMRGSDLDGRTDLYALGLVMYEMLSGRLPFSGDTPLAVLMQRVQGAPVPLDRAGVSVAPEVAALVMKALEKERENRWGSAAEMERAIVAILDKWKAARAREQQETAVMEVPLPVPPSALPRKDYGGTTREAPQPSHWGKLLAYGIAGLGVLAVGLFVARSVLQKPPPENRTIQGVVTDAQNRPVNGAVVQLKDVKSSETRSLKTKAGGAYLFRGLSADVDYLVHADYEGASSGYYELSLSDAREQAAVNLRLGSAALPPAPAEVPAQQAGVPAPRGQSRVNTIDGLTYVYIPAGEFMMGCSPGDNECYDDEKPAHHERIASGFWLGQTEVTQAAWEKVMGGNPSHSRGGQLPAEEVDWNQASAYCKAVGGRLPTEKEWEYAARAGTTGARYGALDAVAWNRNNSGLTTHPVGEKQPNAFGLYDMLGNVWEWTASDYNAFTQVLRGGSWNSATRLVRASDRSGLGPFGRDANVGFRCTAELR